MSDVALSFAVRDSLLSLQNTTDLINRTNSRLASGLEVASAVDDPVAFFTAVGLADRASDFEDRLSGIEQGIQAVTAALDGVEGIDGIVRQLRGLANNLRSARGTAFNDLVTQFNGVRTQIGELANDTEYLGQSLVDSTREELTIRFSTTTSALLLLQSENLRESGIGVNQLISGGTVDVASAAAQGVLTGTDSAVTYSGQTVNLVGGDTTAGVTTQSLSRVVVTFNGTGSLSFDTQGATTLQFDLGTVSITISNNQGGNTAATVRNGDTLTLVLSSSTDTQAFTGGTATFNVAADEFIGVVDNVRVNVGSTDNRAGLIGFGSTQTSVAETADNLTAAELTALLNTASLGVDYTAVEEADTAGFDILVGQLDSAIQTLRTESQSLGSNVALLQTRLDFSESYINTLEVGDGLLTLADLNTEGANLLALQTRQQLGISALAFAGQSEQGILSLFN